MAAVLVAVDVGSTSARAGAFDRDGRMLASASAPFDINRPAPDHLEHDSAQIWMAVGSAVRAALGDARIDARAVAGLAFDATCSLVMLDAGGRPASVSQGGEDRWNVVMWADHRATAEAEELNATGHKVLDYVGGTMSPEMELPKLLWLKRHQPQAWARYGMALDLADYLTWRATGTHAVSACTVTCKWGYLNHERDGWPSDLLARVGLDDLLDRMHIPRSATQLGQRIGQLTPAAAADLGLVPGIPVGAGLIDAHAGGLGVMAATAPAGFDEALALIGGTSTCHMALSAAPRAVPGVWGPYFGAMLPGLWLNEGGQSATGSLLDHVLDLHAEGRQLAGDRHGKVVEHVLRRKAENAGYAHDLLVLPDFHGNRSPLADPDLRGTIHGLALDSSFEGLARLYHAAAAGIVYGTRHILDTLDAHGYRIRRLHLTGGHARNPLLVQLYADATRCEVVLPREPDGVLLGTALAAAAAGGIHADLFAAGQAMVHDGRKIVPDAAAADFHDRGYAAFRRMIEHRREVLSLLGDARLVG